MATSSVQWGRPALCAGAVALLIYVTAAVVGGLPGQRGRGAGPVPLPEPVRRTEPSAPTPTWPPPTSAPGTHVVVPWRELPPRFDTIPSLRAEARFAGVVAAVGHVEPRDPAEPWRFEVTLTAQANDVPLDACPDFTVRARRDDPLGDARYGLDCAGVPFRDATGAPYLPLGRPVTFVFVATAPDARELTWQLLAPQGPLVVVSQQAS